MNKRFLSASTLGRVLAVMFFTVLATPAAAKSGDAAKGLEIYNKRCVWCHGAEGAGDGPGQAFMNPPPRDFTSGVYKIKTTGFEDFIPNDEDIFRMIRDGMPGTAMPGWADILKEQEIWDLVAQIKVFTEIEEKAETQVDFGTPVPSSPESLAKGKELFIDRCAECHGKAGNGVAIKKLKGDLEERTWPRNLTKPWTFRGSNSAKDIYARISVGIPGTQMPSFADPVSKKKLSVEERWHVANYVVSLAANSKKVKAENTVIKATRVEGALPEGPDDAAWNGAAPSTFYLIPQIIGKERFFTPSNDTISARALYNDKEIAIQLEWDDRTRSIPGDETAASIADEELYEDAVAVQLPVVIPKGMKKPYFGMGDTSHPVNIWQWKSGAKDGTESAVLMNAKGFGAIEPRDAASGGLTVKGGYADGVWKVVMRRSLKTGDAENDLQFEEGRFIPIAFAAWDGSNSESGSKHTMTTWYWLLLEPPPSNKPLMIGILIALLLFAGEFWWVRSAAAKRQQQA